MTDDDDIRRRIPATLWWLLLAFAGLTLAAVVWGIPHQEANLAERASFVLGGESVSIVFEGRDAVLSGDVATQADLDRNVARLREVRGVRRVDSSGVVVATNGATPPPFNAVTNPPELKLAISGRSVTLTGRVPDAATAAAIVRAAEIRWGQSNVMDQLEVSDEVSGAAWLAGIVTAIDGIDDLDDGSIALGASGVLLEGSVATESARTSIAETFAIAMGGSVPIENRLEVVSLPDPTFAAALVEGGMVRLTGVLPDQGSVDSIEAAATAIYGSANVTNEMTIGPRSSPDYVLLLPGVFGAIDGLVPWSVAVAEGRVVVTGLAVSDEALADTVSRLSTALDSSDLVVDNQAQVDPNAVATVLTELLKGSATFKIGSAVLSSEAMILLDQAVEILIENPSTVLIVEGHTDDVGSDAANLALSEARAQAVVEYLIAGGIGADRLTAVGLGETQPIADNSTADGRAQNRRIQFVVEEGDN